MQFPPKRRWRLASHQQPQPRLALQSMAPLLQEYSFSPPVWLVEGWSLAVQVGSNVNSVPCENATRGIIFSSKAPVRYSPHSVAGVCPIPDEFGRCAHTSGKLAALFLLRRWRCRGPVIGAAAQQSRTGTSLLAISFPRKVNGLAVTTKTGVFLFSV
jgi:hypothetical protein